MTVRSIRRFAWACAPAAVLAVALGAPGAASAEPGGTQCGGVDIEGKGASLQKLSQIEVWTPEFKNPANTNALACSGSQGSKGVRNVTYTSTGSGAFLRSWGQETKEASEVIFDGVALLHVLLVGDGCGLHMSRRHVAALAHVAVKGCIAFLTSEHADQA